MGGTAGVSPREISTSTLFLNDMLLFLNFLLLFAGVLAQDTHKCPDGWHVSDIDGVCLWLGGLDERVTKADAEAICAYHDAWLADVCCGTKSSILKQLLSQADGRGPPGRPGMQWSDQWWLGATCMGEHGSHNWGDWKWDHLGSDVEWYDWMRNEPNDWRTQSCLTFLKDQDIFGYGTYHWNDWDCASTARFICERGPIS